MYYIGFDLGDGESSLSWFNSDEPSVMPRTIPIFQSNTFPTAVAIMRETGETVIGSNATSNAPTLEHLRVCFKRDFIKGGNDVYESYRRFIFGVIAELRKADLPFNPFNRDECRFVVGQPADWDEETLRDYRSLLESCGITDPYMISESRAALVYCSTATYMVAHDPSSSNILVCDFGSSTLDFAFSVKGDNSNVMIFGDPRLGGGLMDEQIVLESIARIRDDSKRMAARDLFDTKKDIRARLMMTARKLKEEFFTDPDMTPLMRSIPLFRQEVTSVVIYMDMDIIEKVIMYPQPLLGNNSLYEQLQEQFSKAVEITKDTPPEIILLTGGASRMGFFRDLCRETFQKYSPKIVFSDSPETDIANGLALDGWYAEKLVLLKKKIQEYVNGSHVERIIEEELPVLVCSISNGTINEMLSNEPQKPGAIRVAFRKWKNADTTQSINDMKIMVEDSVRGYCTTNDFARIIENIVSEWMEGVLPRIQNDLDRICIDLNLNPAHVSLKRIKFTESVNVDGTVFHPGTTVIDILDTIVTGITAFIVGALAGGGGIALISTGLVGVIVGVVAVIAARIAFGRKAKDAVMNVKLANAIRHCFTDGSVFNEKSIHEMKLTFANLLSQQDTMKETICKMLSNHVDAIILAVSSQTKV